VPEWFLIDFSKPNNSIQVSKDMPVKNKYPLVGVDFADPIKSKATGAMSEDVGNMLGKVVGGALSSCFGGNSSGGKQAEFESFTVGREGGSLATRITVRTNAGTIETGSTILDYLKDLKQSQPQVFANLLKKPADQNTHELAILISMTGGTETVLRKERWKTTSVHSLFKDINVSDPLLLTLAEVLKLVVLAEDEVMDLD
jgi:hypothetical protein